MPRRANQLKVVGPMLAQPKIVAGERSVRHEKEDGIPVVSHCHCQSVIRYSAGTDDGVLCHKGLEIR